VQATVDTAHAVGLTGLLKITVPAEPGAPFTVAEKAGTWPVQRDAALGLLSVLFWGYRMWWQRRPTRAGRVRLAPPVQRGNLRALSQPVVFAIVLAAVVIGWLLPVLGVSLLLFLTGDAAAGALARRRTRRPA
jgi:uncharacterized iron-regulated membrane protein